MIAQLLKPDGTYSDIVPKNGKNFKLDETYAILGVDIVQVVRLKKNQILIVDEEGLLKNNPQINHAASKLAQEAGTAEGIVGNAIWCDSKMFK